MFSCRWSICIHLFNKAVNILGSQRWFLGVTWPIGLGICGFYARKQLLLSARLSHRNSVRPSVCPSVCHTGVFKGQNDDCACSGSRDL